MGAELFWELCFLFWELFFFYGFNWRWRRFRWGWAVPAEEVGFKRRTAGGGLGGRAQRLPQMHWQNMLRDSPSASRILGALCSHSSSVRGKTSCALRFIFFVSCVHEGLGPLGSYFFGGLRFFGALGSLKIWCCVHKCSVNSAKFCGLSEVLFFLLVSCVSCVFGVSGS